MRKIKSSVKGGVGGRRCVLSLKRLKTLVYLAYTGGILGTPETLVLSDRAIPIFLRSLMNSAYEIKGANRCQNARKNINFLELVGGRLQPP